MFARSGKKKEMERTAKNAEVETILIYFRLALFLYILVLYVVKGDWIYIQ